MSNDTLFTTNDLISKFENKLKDNANYQNNKTFFDNVIDAVRELKSICDNDCLKSSTYDDIDTISKINTNSLYFIDDLPWKEKDVASLSSSKIMQVLNDLVRSICDNPKVLQRRSGTNNDEKCIIEQAWRLFSIILYAFVSGNYIQMMSLLDTNYSIAMINYMTDGDLTDCQNHICYLFRNSRPRYISRDKMEQQNKKNKIDFKVTTDYKELENSNGCQSCKTLNNGKSNPLQIYPCYNLIKKVEMKCNDTYSDSLFPSFLYLNFEEFNQMTKQVFLNLRNAFLMALLKKSNYNNPLSKYEFSNYSWYLVKNSFKKNDCYYSSNKDYGVFVTGSFQSNNKFDFKRVNVIDAAISASNLRNILAHGNVKELQNVKEQKRDTSNMFYNKEKLKDEIINSLINQFEYLLCLSKDIYFVDYDDNNVKKIFGLEMANYFFMNGNIEMQMTT